MHLSITAAHIKQPGKVTLNNKREIRYFDKYPAERSI